VGAAPAQASPATPEQPSQIGGTIKRPHAVVTTPDGKIYVAEFGYFHDENPPDGDFRRRILVYEPDRAGSYPREPKVLAGTTEQCETADTAAACGEGGPATEAKLGNISGLAVDAAGRVYLAENFWNRIRVIGTDGNIRTVQSPSRGLNVPEGMAYDATTNSILVTDKRNDRLLSFRATNGGPTPVTWTAVAGRFSGHGTAPGVNRCPSPTDPCGDGGPATSAQLNQPGGVAVDEAGVIYLADSRNFRVRRIARDGTISQFAGTGVTCRVADECGDGGPARAARFGGDPQNRFSEGPFGIVTSPDGAVYIADSEVDTVRRVLPDGTIEKVVDLDHPKAPYPLRTPTGHDLIVPVWDDDTVVRVPNIDRFDLTVVKAGTGTGTVTGPGIDCGTDCTQPTDGRPMTLTATPAPAPPSPAGPARAARARAPAR
jgi:sugar lactone lactonase YvrE